MDRVIPYSGPSLTGNIVENKTKISPCQECDAKVTYLYEVTMEGACFWFAECPHCDFLSIVWEEN